MFMFMLITFYFPNLRKCKTNSYHDHKEHNQLFSQKRVHFALPHFQKKYFNLRDQAFTAGLATRALSLALLSPSLFLYFFIYYSNEINDPEPLTINNFLRKANNRQKCTVCSVFKPMESTCIVLSSHFKLNITMDNGYVLARYKLVFCCMCSTKRAHT